MPSCKHRQCHNTIMLANAFSPIAAYALQYSKKDDYEKKEYDDKYDKKDDKYDDDKVSTLTAPSA